VDARKPSPDPAWGEPVGVGGPVARGGAGRQRVRGRAAVTNGLTLPWNSGAVEGTVFKLKAIKRSMFGRANFDLLRKRVLVSP
jgi:transposase